MLARPVQWRPRFVRNSDAGYHLENFLVAAVAAVLGIRVYLELSGYPQLGGHGLHIAHMLWGGLLMLVAVVVLLAFLGRRIQHLAAIVAGIGFGTFIDELGKFITSDNNYFFQPTIALIYALFVLLFLGFRAIEHRPRWTDEERLLNAIDLLRDALLTGDAAGERERALALLAGNGAARDLTPALRAALAPLVPSEASAPVRRDLFGPARGLYYRLVGWRWFQRGIVGFFVVYAVGTVASLIALIVTDPAFTVLDPAMSFADWGATLSSALSTGCVLIGTVVLRHAPLLAYQWFQRGVLVSVFLVQFFSFYTEQLGATFGLAIDLLLLGGLNYMIAQERRRQLAAPEQAPAPAAAARSITRR